MLKLKLQYFGHLMQRVNSLENTLIMGKIEGRRRWGWQGMRGCGITVSIDISLSKLREVVRDREAWHAAVHGVTESPWNMTEWLNIKSIPKYGLCCLQNQRSLLENQGYFFMVGNFLSHILCLCFLLKEMYQNTQITGSLKNSFMCPISEISEFLSHTVDHISPTNASLILTMPCSPLV